jgi:hypothetical protein
MLRTGCEDELGNFINLQSLWYGTRTMLKILLMIFICFIIIFWCYDAAVKSWADSDKDASDDAPKNEEEKTPTADKFGNETTDKIPPPVEKLLIGQKGNPEPKKEHPEPKVLDNLPKPPKGTVGPAVVEHAEAQLDRDNLQQQKRAEVEVPKRLNQPNEAGKPTVEKLERDVSNKTQTPVEKLLIGQKESPKPEKERLEPKVVDNSPEPPKGTIGPAVAEYAEAQLDRDNFQQQKRAEVESPKRQNQQDVLPSCPQIYQNYPNPFNPETWFPYSLSKESNVIIKIYNINGQTIRTLDLGHKLPAFYVKQEQAAYWDGRDNQGYSMASGVYFYVLQTENFTATRKMLLIR